MGKTLTLDRKTDNPSQLRLELNATAQVEFELTTSVLTIVITIVTT